MILFQLANELTTAMCLSDVFQGSVLYLFCEEGEDLLICSP